MSDYRSSQSGAARDSTLILDDVTPRYPVLAFDPGATTGFAALSGNGVVLTTQALLGVDQLEHWLEFLAFARNTIEDVVDVAIEVGPQTHHHSPVTRRVEQMLREEFPHAHLVQPGQWKGHPAVRRTHCSRARTLHERDAVGLALWLQATRREHEEQPARTTTARAHPERP